MDKVLVLTYYWPPSGGPGVQRWLKFVKYLPELGYLPHVITVDPTLATYPVQDPSLVDEVSEKATVHTTETREPYKYYQRLLSKKEVPYSGFANEQKGGVLSAFSRFVRGNFFVPDARKGWNAFAIAKAEKLIAEIDPGVIITTSPPHSSQLAGLYLKKKYPHLKWIADMRDPWTDIYYYGKMYHLPFVKKKDRKLEQRVLENADAIITVSNDLKRVFQKKVTPGLYDRFHVIPNGYDPDDFVLHTDYQPSDDFTITYTGTLSPEYDISGFIKAMKIAEQQLGKKIQLKFVGAISDQWRRALQKVFSVEIINHVSHKEAIRHMLQTHMLLLVIPAIENNKGIVTGKIFEYMAAERPVLGIGPVDGDAALMLEQTKSGMMFDYRDDHGMEKYVLQFALDHKHWLPDRAKVKSYSRRALTGKLLKIMQGYIL